MIEVTTTHHVARVTASRFAERTVEPQRPQAVPVPLSVVKVGDGSEKTLDAEGPPVTPTDLTAERRTETLAPAAGIPAAAITEMVTAATTTASLRQIAMTPLGPRPCFDLSAPQLTNDMSRSPYVSVLVFRSVGVAESGNPIRQNEAGRPEGHVPGVAVRLAGFETVALPSGRSPA